MRFPVLIDLLFAAAAAQVFIGGKRAYLYLLLRQRVDFFCHKLPPMSNEQ